MGTNYYLMENCCSECNRADERYHVGKSSAGWCFSLHVDEQEGIQSLGDLFTFIEEGDFVIQDEYRQTLSVEQLLVIISERSRGESRKNTPYGYDSWEDFHKENHSEDGPNNLLRHKIDDGHCVGHGEGPYDFVTGEFC